MSLPTLSTPKLEFTRRYSPNSEPGVLNFETSLTLLDTNQTLENSIPLLALTKKDLEGILTQGSFGSLQWYGDFKGSPWSPESFLTVVVAR